MILMVTRIPKVPFDRLTPSGTSTLSPFNKPIASVKPGDEVEIETWDAFGGCVTETQTRQQALEKGVKVPVNPITGPVYVEGAEPGDTLTVEILGIELPDSGATTISPGFGSLEGWLNLMAPRTKISKIKAGKVLYKTDVGQRRRGARRPVHRHHRQLTRLRGDKHTHPWPPRRQHGLPRHTPRQHTPPPSQPARSPLRPRRRPRSTRRRRGRRLSNRGTLPS